MILGREKEGRYRGECFAGGWCVALRYTLILESGRLATKLL